MPCLKNPIRRLLHFSPAPSPTGPGGKIRSAGYCVFPPPLGPPAPRGKSDQQDIAFFPCPFAHWPRGKNLICRIWHFSHVSSPTAPGGKIRSACYCIFPVPSPTGPGRKIRSVGYCIFAQSLRRSATGEKSDQQDIAFFPRPFAHRPRGENPISRILQFSLAPSPTGPGGKIRSVTYNMKISPVSGFAMRQFIFFCIENSFLMPA